MTSRRRRFAVVLCLLAGLATGHGVARAGDDLDAAKNLHQMGLKLLDGTGDPDDLDRVREGLDDLRKADTLYAKIEGDPNASKAWKDFAGAARREIQTKLEWWAVILPSSGPRGGAKRPDAKLEDPVKGAILARWCDTARVAYAAEPEPLGRAAIAVKIAVKAEQQGLPLLFDLFKSEKEVAAREGLLDALTLLGGLDVAKEMGTYARPEDCPLRRDALEVVYRCLEKPEKQEPERPFCQAIRRFHELKDHKFSEAIIARLDAMGWQGTAAIGEVLYVDDFGAQGAAYEALSRKKDSRAVTPLVFRLDRFSFEDQEQMPAHKALLAIGWFAVPELVDRWNDPAAGIWISWTLRKITGRHAGTDRKKWTEWWKVEAPKRPEITEANAEPAPTGGASTTPSGK